ncbi:MAG: HD family hydrolase [Rhodobiaceae bacterium]|nr:HD family hydrolase [Rhodobiaceae bacterium]
MAPPKKPAPKKSKTPRAWQRMLSGRRLDLLDPSPFDVEIEDIAHGLARVARWNGQTIGDEPFSVAEHSVLVEEICHRLRPGWPAKWRLAALLHDAPEYVIGDMISPFKAALGYDYKSFEHRLESAIHLRFGLPADLPKTVESLIKRADRASAFLEATQLAGFSDEEAAAIFGRPRGLTPTKLKPLNPTAAQALFLKRFKSLLKSTEQDSPASNPG